MSAYAKAGIIGFYKEHRQKKGKHQVHAYGFIEPAILKEDAAEVFGECRCCIVSYQRLKAFVAG